MMFLGLALLISVVMVMAYHSQMFRKGLYRALRWGAAIAVIGLLGIGGYMLYDSRQQTEQKTAMQRWNWSRYTGPRIVCEPYSLDGCDASHGVWSDKKTGTLCTDSSYPGYPACPAQEQVFHGEPIPPMPKGYIFDEKASEAAGKPIGTPVVITPDPVADSKIDLSAGFTPTPKHHVKTIDGIVNTDEAVYSESGPSGPSGQILGKTSAGEHVQVLERDSVYDCVRIKTPTGIVGWISASAVKY
jgi:hypothetical protein